LNQKVEYDKKTIDLLEKELLKKKKQLERLKGLEDIFNNGEYEEFQKSKLKKPQSGMVLKKVNEETHKDQTQQSRNLCLITKSQGQRTGN
jgi:hypothetical protein